ncbi:MAG TPA: SRPBCC domain-containing protein [Candidatus Paceibacterota bacterium]
MEPQSNFKNITIETTINKPIEIVWDAWNQPAHIMQWSHASDDWNTPFAENDLRTGGILKIGYGSPDGQHDFTFEATYTAVEPLHHIAYVIGDGRSVDILFTQAEGGTKIIQTFAMENQNTEELQRAGWSAILENFKKHAESL